METLYLDHASSTPVRPDVLEAMRPWLTGPAGNPSSLHRLGQRARQALEVARERVAACLGARPTEILFTSGGTESNNLALLGAARAAGPRGRRHLLASAIEHQAVLNVLRALEREGFTLTLLPVDGEGFVARDALRDALRPETALLSLMLANNETGVVEPVAELAPLLRERGILLHTDAVQAVGKLPVNVEALGVDLLSLSAHKFNGPRGVGALYVRAGTRIEPVLFGGHQERRLRPGTENVAGVVGLARALELAQQELPTWPARLAALRDRLEQAVFSRIPGAVRNGPADARLPHILNVAFAGVEGEALLLALDVRGVCLSTGSACTSGATEPSHVLQAMGLEPARARGSVRFSLGPGNTPDQIDRVVEHLAQAVTALRAASPLPGSRP